MKPRVFALGLLAASIAMLPAIVIMGRDIGALRTQNSVLVQRLAAAEQKAADLRAFTDSLYQMEAQNYNHLGLAMQEHDKRLKHFEHNMPVGVR